MIVNEISSSKNGGREKIQNIYDNEKGKRTLDEDEENMKRLRTK